MAFRNYWLKCGWVSIEFIVTLQTIAVADALLIRENIRVKIRAVYSRQFRDGLGFLFLAAQPKKDNATRNGFCSNIRLQTRRENVPGYDHHLHRKTAVRY